MMPKAVRIPALLALAGATTVLAFSPAELPGLMFAALAVLFWSFHTAGTAAIAAGRGFAFGLGYFTANVHWVYISLHNFGGMPGWMAAGCVLALAACLALYPALAGWLSHRLPCPEHLRLPLLIPAVYILVEWLRGWLFTGFPWASTGSSQIGPLAGWFPLLGVYGVGGLVALTSAWVLWRWRWGVAALALAVLTSLGLEHIAWTHPAGNPVSVSLVQGAVPQSLKWNPAQYRATLALYLDLTRQSRGDIVILPETAIPSFMENTPPEYLAALSAPLAQQGRHLLTGFATGNDRRYFNSLVLLTDPAKVYHKQHLVPFGEYVPLPWIFGWMYNYLNMPLSGFTSGGLGQPPLVMGATRLAGNICYEDIFGNELRKAAANATLLANVSNMAWFEGSWAAEQHLQMARARTLETGRWMIRATNTGATAIIDHRGKVRARLEEGQRGILEGTAQNREGTTPYMLWGDSLTIGLLGGLLLGLIGHAGRRRQLR